MFGRDYEVIYIDDARQPYRSHKLCCYVLKTQYRYITIPCLGMCDKQDMVGDKSEVYEVKSLQYSRTCVIVKLWHKTEASSKAECTVKSRKIECPMEGDRPIMKRHSAP